MTFQSSAIIPALSHILLGVSLVAQKSLAIYLFFTTMKDNLNDGLIINFDYISFFFHFSFDYHRSECCQHR